MRKCLNGHLVDEKSKYCSQCGAEVIDYLNYCAHCGHKRSGDEKYCIKCCASLGNTSNSCDVQDLMLANKKKNFRKNTMLVLGVLIFLFVCGGLCWKCFLHQDLSLGSLAFWNKDYSLEKLANIVHKCDDVGDFHEGRAWFCKDGKYGFIDKMGNIIVPAKYDEVADFKEERAWVAIRDENEVLRCGYIDLTGKNIVPVKYRVPFAEGDVPIDFSDGMAAVLMGTDEYGTNLYGYINRQGDEIIPAEFSIYGDFHNGVAFVDNEKYIDKTGKVLTKEELRGYKETTTCFQNEKMGLKRLDGNLIIPCEYDIVQDLSEGMSAVCKGNLWGYVDSLGSNIIPCSYYSEHYYDGELIDDDWGEGGAPDEAHDFHEGMVVVMKDGKAGFLNAKGENSIPFNYERAYDFSEEMAAVKNDDKWGFINIAGHSVIACQYDAVCSFSEGMAAIMKNGKCGYVNKKGEEIVPCIYDKPIELEKMRDFHEGLAMVKKNGICGFVDKTGKSTFDVSRNEENKKEQEAYDYANQSSDPIVLKGYLDSYKGANLTHASLIKRRLDEMENAVYVFVLRGDSAALAKYLEDFDGVNIEHEIYIKEQLMN